MKTKLFGILAIAIAVGLTAFNTPAKSAVKMNYYWFLITQDGLATNAQVPSADAQYVQEGATAPDESADCSGSNYQCVSGFSSSQVNGSDQLKDDHQVPIVIGQKQD